ncbi:MAG: GNAT family N-acetyltransferase [Anaerolineales bacterium]|nr:GNAT family N-acetyltransferase [Anaerolineales bacterium]
MEETPPIPQLQMVWPQARLEMLPIPKLPAGYHLRTYKPGDETSFYKVMALAGWPGWDMEKLKPWLYRILPEGWFMAVHTASDQIVASAMATHDPTWLYPFCAELGWVAADPAHSGKGLGTAVVAAATARMITGGYTHVRLYTEPFRHPALKIYLKLGYLPYLAAPEESELWQEVCKQLDWPFTPGEWMQATKE